MRHVYFDHNATTPLDPRVRDAMLPWLGERVGNPSSLHRFGRQAREALEEARASVAALLGARPREVVFTASGTEANNAVLLHLARQARFRGHVVVSAFEHPSIGVVTERLEAEGMEVSRVAPTPAGTIDPAEMIAALREETVVVCLMMANNELGTIQPVVAVAEECRRRSIPLHCDAAQAVGKVDVDVNRLGVDFLSLGAHKFHGPLGAGALWVREGSSIEGLLLGGGQERGRRASTENLPAIVGLGAAAELGRRELAQRARLLGGLRARFECGLDAVGDTVVHCRHAPRLPHTSHVAFLGVEGESLLLRLDAAGFAVSTGSACASGRVEPSATLLAMGLSASEALASVRISFGMTNTEEEVDLFLAELPRHVNGLRRLAPVD